LPGLHLKTLQRLIIRPLGESDPADLAGLLSGSPDEYTRFFHPFEFEAAVIALLAFKAVLDQWFMLEVEEAGMFRPAGFYMLRGLDEGFPDPMYGVFVTQRFAGRGLARLTLAHAESQCRLNGWKNLRLKVDPQNVRAHKLYLACGFEFESVDPNNDNQVVLRRKIPQ
jgi:GNAT superfamily N-acetyltransferase